MDIFFMSTDANEIFNILNICNEYGLIGERISYGCDGLLLANLKICDLDRFYGVDISLDTKDGYYAEKFPDVYSDKHTCVSLIDKDNIKYGDHSINTIENIIEFKELLINFVNKG